ncbi:heat shock 22 kDa protein, mitochondrial-like [Salvia miltiorrhiza]|uniref:heat shock 22 kDa protein, mitochondrial-like n=1 Tax=Salvia miltiorrhiza TaxID=226208 RepID=UPI0025AB6F25|nr:heat shock 22 kDa protein, mitochondrial-like [Salvia miltiorrhiza]
MASSLALKRLISSSNLLSTSIRPVAYSRRLFNTNAVREYDSEDRDSDVGRRPDRRVFGIGRRPDAAVFSPFALADMLSPFPTRSSLSQILNMMDQMMETPASGGGRRSWEARETEEGLQLRVDMPGLGKEDVKVSVEQNTLTIRGEGKKENEEEESGRRYMSRIDLPEKLYKTNEIKAEMKNGVLKVFVPRIQEEQKNDVFQVNID